MENQWKNKFRSNSSMLYNFWCFVLYTIFVLVSRPSLSPCLLLTLFLSLFLVLYFRRGKHTAFVTRKSKCRQFKAKIYQENLKIMPRREMESKKKHEKWLLFLYSEILFACTIETAFNDIQATIHEDKVNVYLLVM